MAEEQVKQSEAQEVADQEAEPSPSEDAPDEEEAGAVPEEETTEAVADAPEEERPPAETEQEAGEEVSAEEIAEAMEAVKPEAQDAEDLTAQEEDAPQETDAPDEGEGGTPAPAAEEASEEEAPPQGPISRVLEEAVEQAAGDLVVPSAAQAGVKPAGEEDVMVSMERPTAMPPTAGEYGFTGEVTGRVVTQDDLDKEQVDEEASSSYDQLRQLVDTTFVDVRQDEIISGRVVTVGEKEVTIDIGFKSDGVVSRDEFAGEMKPGQEVEVYLERLEDYYGQLVLSKEKADQVRRWEKIEQAYENEAIIEGTIVRRIKGGMITELDVGVEAFLPGSQIDVRPVRDFDAYLEKRMEFKIVKLNRANENIVVSHRALIQEELDEQREKILSEMEAGQVLRGIVKNITDFGVFIDLGGVDGLLHITDLSWGRVSHPSEVVDLDEELDVVVLNYEEERQRISLGLKQLREHPWENIEEKFEEGDTVEGKVVSITNYGAFVELEKGIEGLVHISEMSWTDHIRHPSQMVSLGQLVEIKILNINTEEQKISLGMKQLEPDPWEGIAERYPAGTVMSGMVRNITNFGVFVEIEPGIDGLVHISDLSWTKKIRHPGEIASKGEEMDVQILNIDEERRRISLGHKQINTNPWNDFAKVYAEGSNHEAEVTRVVDSGLVVELPLEVEAFVPASELKNGPQNFQSFYGEGDEMELRVIRFDLGDKEIILSEEAVERAEQQAERQRERHEEREERRQRERQVREYQQQGGGDKPATGATTLGELSGLAELKNKFEEEDEGQKAQTTGEQAAHQHPGEEEPEGAAAAAEAAEADEEDVTGTSDEPQATTSSEESVGEIESFTEAGSEEEGEKAVTAEAVKEQAEADEGEVEPEADAEMGKADATVEADSQGEAEAVTDQPEDAARTTYVVVPHDDGWAVRKEGAERATGVFDTKAEAKERAREVAKSHTPSKLIFHKQDGSVQESFTYDSEE